MRKKGLGLMALLCVPVLLFSCDAGNGTEQQNNKSYYELTYYDELDDNIKYNRELFYENENINIGADPSVVYGRGSDGKDHFYVYPTGSQYRYYAYQSDDMANWTGVGDVFIPEADCWRGGNMWAPDVIYDPDVDDGLGGKGLYYMFFTANDKTRNNKFDGKYFGSREERVQYEQIKSDVAGMSDDAVKAEMALGVEALTEKYNVKEENSWIVVTEVAHFEAEPTADVARNAIISFKTANFNILYGGLLYAGGIATSKTLDGPFVQYTNDGTDGNRKLKVSDPFLTHEDLYEALNEKYGGVTEALTVVDMHAFVDPKTGDKYMYFDTKPQVKHTISATCEIFVVKVGDKNARWTDDWQWETITQLTRTGYINMTENKPTSDLNETAINEGAYVIYNPDNDKYYLTVSKGRYTTIGYAVLQAIGDSPMGPFEKVLKADGGFLVKSTDTVIGPGHHSFITYGGKTYIVYHQHVKSDASGDRAVSVDEVKWIKNSKGVDIMYVNGPSRSPQAIFANSEYDNIAGQATLTVENGQEGTEKNLIDGLYGATTDIDFVNEFSATKENCTITLSFNDYKTVRAIMIYNSKDCEKAFTSVKRIEFDFKKKDGTEGVAYIDDLKFNEKYFYTLENGENKVLPCAAAIAEFGELSVNKIRVYFTDKTVNVSEIVVLGK